MIFLGVIFALAAAVWWMLLVRRFGLLVGGLSVVLVGACLGHPFFHVSVITLDRLLWAVVMFGYVWQRWRGTAEPKPWHTGDLWFAIFLGVLTVSTFRHDFRIEGAQPASRLLFLYLMPAGLYWVARQQPITPKNVRHVAWIAACFGIYLSVTGVAEVLKLSALIFPRYIGSSEHAEFLGRARGPLLNPSANGIYIGTALGCWWMFWFGLSQRGKTLLLLGSGVFFVGALATLTRCVWLGILLSGMLVLWLALPRSQQWGILLLAGTIGLTGLAVGGKHLVAFKRDENVSVSEMAESAKLRPILAVIAWQILLDRPLTGVGFGQYKQADSQYIAQRRSDLPLDKARPYHQHNVLLSLITETGLLGSIPFLAVLVSWSRTALRLWRSRQLDPWYRAAGLIFLISLTNYLANGLFQDVALMQMVNMLLFFWAGVLVSIASHVGLTANLRLPFPRSANAPAQLTA